MSFWGEINKYGGMVELNTKTVMILPGHPQNLDLRFENWFLVPLSTYKPITQPLVDRF